MFILESDNQSTLLYDMDEELYSSSLEKEVEPLWTALGDLNRALQSMQVEHGIVVNVKTFLQEQYPDDEEDDTQLEQHADGLRNKTLQYRQRLKDLIMEKLETLVDEYNLAFPGDFLSHNRRVIQEKMDHHVTLQYFINPVVVGLLEQWQRKEREDIGTQLYPVVVGMAREEPAAAALMKSLMGQPNVILVHFLTSPPSLEKWVDNEVKTTINQAALKQLIHVSDEIRSEFLNEMETLWSPAQRLKAFQSSGYLNDLIKDRFPKTYDFYPTVRQYIHNEKEAQRITATLEQTFNGKKKPYDKDLRFKIYVEALRPSIDDIVSGEKLKVVVRGVINNKDDVLSKGLRGPREQVQKWVFEAFLSFKVSQILSGIDQDTKASIVSSIVRDHDVKTLGLYAEKYDVMRKDILSRAFGPQVTSTLLSASDSVLADMIKQPELLPRYLHVLAVIIPMVGEEKAHDAIATIGLDALERHVSDPAQLQSMIHELEGRQADQYKAKALFSSFTGR